MKVQVLEDFYIPGQPKVQKGVEMEMPYETANTLISRGVVKQLGKDTKKEEKQPGTPKSGKLEASVVEEAVEKNNKLKK